jgi:hypothetical protein
VDQQGLSLVFGNAIVSLFEWTWPRMPPRVRDFAQSVKEYVLPDPPMTVCTPSGEIITGFLVVDRSRVVVFVGTRTPGRHADVDQPPRRYGNGRGPMWPEADSNDFGFDPFRR